MRASILGLVIHALCFPDWPAKAASSDLLSKTNNIGFQCSKHQFYRRH